MQQDETWTVGRLLDWTTKFLADHEKETPRLDSELLLAEARDCNRIDLYTAFNEEVTPEVRTRFRELVRRRGQGVPVAYLIGRREFYSLSFEVSEDVLIPRPETEFVVVSLLELVEEFFHDHHQLAIADVGTGSGILAICAALNVTGCHVTATDICEKALQIGRRNAQSHEVEERIDFISSDLLSSVTAESRFQFILSNPPYVSEVEFLKLDRDVSEYEPRTALVSGPTGTEIFARLIPQAAERLDPEGWLLMEISPMIERRVHSLLTEDGRFDMISTVHDLARLPRVVRARRRVG